MDPPRPRPDCPLVVAYGLGVNSTAMLVEFAKRHGLKIGTIASLIEHRSRNESLIERVGTRKMLTQQGEFDCATYRDRTGGLQSGRRHQVSQPSVASRSRARQASPCSASRSWVRRGRSPTGSEVASPYSVGPTRRAIVPRPRVPLIQ